MGLEDKQVPRRLEITPFDPYISLELNVKYQDKLETSVVATLYKLYK